MNKRNHTSSDLFQIDAKEPTGLKAVVGIVMAFALVVLLVIVIQIAEFLT